MEANNKWSEIRNWVNTIAIVLIPVVVALIGHSYTKALKEREIQLQFVKIAINILQSKPTEHTRNVREWATQVINLYSGVPLSKDAKRDLIEKVPLSQTKKSGPELSPNSESHYVEPGYVEPGYIEESTTAVQTNKPGQK